MHVCVCTKELTMCLPVFTMMTHRIYDLIEVKEHSHVSLSTLDETKSVTQGRNHTLEEESREINDEIRGLPPSVPHPSLPPSPPPTLSLPPSFPPHQPTVSLRLLTESFCSSMSRCSPTLLAL